MRDDDANDAMSTSDMAANSAELASPSAAATSSSNNNNTDQTVQVSDEEDVPDSVKSSQEYAELMWLKLVRKVKSARSHEQATTNIMHVGFRCDHCSAEPISGTRWHCFTCPPETSIDLCDKCLPLAASRSGHHKANHKLTPVVKSHVDQHQHQYQPGGRDAVVAGVDQASYLQSNFMSDV